jgi:DNA-binding transcriptional LysR family regulator
MQLYLLRTFVTVAEQGHLTRAATLLHVTQPAISGQIKALEELLGLKLFERSPIGVRLTKAGEALLPKAAATLAAGSATSSARCSAGNPGSTSNSRTEFPPGRWSR